MVNRDTRATSRALELRSAGDVSQLAGDAVVYNEWSELLGTFYERIAPGAFDACLARSPDVIACYDHEVRQILGRTAAGTLRLDNSPTALRATLTSLPDTTYARDLVSSVKRGDIKGMSFVFDCLEDSWEHRDGKLYRTVLKAELYEVSFVVFPAYPGTSVSARSMQAAEHSTWQATLRRNRLRLDFAARELV